MSMVDNCQSLFVSVLISSASWDSPHSLGENSRKTGIRRNRLNSVYDVLERKPYRRPDVCQEVPPNPDGVW